MYDLRFTATDDADWSQAVELIDNATNEPLADAETATFELEVTDCGSVRLSATTADSTISKPEPNVIQWRFTATQMAGLDTGRTYTVGCTMETDGGKIQLFVGQLAVVDGGFA